MGPQWRRIRRMNRLCWSQCESGSNWHVGSFESNGPLPADWACPVESLWSPGGGSKNTISLFSGNCHRVRLLSQTIYTTHFCLQWYLYEWRTRYLCIYIYEYFKRLWTYNVLWSVFRWLQITLRSVFEAKFDLFHRLQFESIFTQTVPVSSVPS